MVSAGMQSDQPQNGVSDEAADGGPSSSSSKRRRTPSQTSRGVANLTPEQLAKKRANDREAQRAIRVRTKTQIENLEQRIKDLTSQQPYQDLQQVQQREQAIKAENEDIKRQLSNIVSMLQPLIGNGIKHEPAPAQWSYPNKHLPTLPPPIDRRSESRGAGYPGLSPLLSHYDPRSPANMSRSTSISMSRTDSHAFEPPPPPLVTGYTVFPKNLRQTCPLDGLLLEVVNKANLEIKMGVPVREVIGPHYPDITAIARPEREHNHKLSGVLSGMIQTFPDVSDLPEKICVIYLMYLYYQWRISPTRENYERLPDWMAPRASQLHTPHPVWIDSLPWPKMRDSLVYDYEQYAFDDFFIPYTASLSVNWPYEPMSCVIPTQGEGLMMSPQYEAHIRDITKWSLGPEFQREFPKLCGGVQIKQKRKYPYL